MKITEHEMLITLATMALVKDDLVGHDVIESLRALGYGHVIAEAREMQEPAPLKSDRYDFDKPPRACKPSEHPCRFCKSPTSRVEFCSRACEKDFRDGRLDGTCLD